jgi:hydrogenase maturation protein HypF
VPQRPDQPARRHSVIETRRLTYVGHVQGVGFRPFVHRLAHALGLSGWVRNRSGQVEIEIRGPATLLDRFEADMLAQHPPLARPELAARELARSSEAAEGFEILDSADDIAAQVHIPADQFTCDDCLAEMRDPAARRYRYPFTNCTQCGPRYTLIERLPYDRAHTSMAGFPLCPDCAQEYANPLDRRFHAEPLACPVCGPRLSLETADARIDGTEAALHGTLDRLRDGGILAIKGVGGYHLVCDAGSETTVARLRDLKHRPDKPLAVLFPWAGPDGLEVLRRHLRPSDAEAHSVTAPQRPIVLMRTRSDHGLAPSIAPGLTEVGAMLPYSPLHHLLAEAFGGPLVATSANFSGEPVLTDNAETRERLAAICDAFLHHDRPIVRPADDSVLRHIAGAPRRLRIGRGIAPLELPAPRPFAAPVLAVGGHLKNTIALGWDDRIVVSPHIGELDNPRSLAVFRQVVEDLCTLYRVRPEWIAHDAHPQYASTRWAQGQGLATLAVPHHRAHAAMLAGEYPEPRRWIVFTWDGTGLGEDGHIWGGETLLGQPGDWRRVGSLRSFRLPGGDRAGREPWRSAAALCWAVGQDYRPAGLDIDLARQAWGRGLNCPLSTAAGRVFDAAAALLGLCEQGSFEGQGPMWLEAVASDAGDDFPPLTLQRDASGLWTCDWAALLPWLRDPSRSVAERSRGLHLALADALCRQAMLLLDEHGDCALGLSGGVFQNRLLCELVVERLSREGLRVYLPERIPYNDAGLSFGQLIEACSRLDTR